MPFIQSLQTRYQSISQKIEALTDGWFIEALSRLVFAGVLAGYFWNAAILKLQARGAFDVTTGTREKTFTLIPQSQAYAQIVPWTERGQYGFIDDALVWIGTYAELILPAMIIVGLFGRFAAAAMIVFVVVLSVVDVVGHNLDAATIGAWFDNLSNALVLDQRALWVLLLSVIVVKGPGKLSIDHLLGDRLLKK